MPPKGRALLSPILPSHPPSPGQRPPRRGSLSPLLRQAPFPQKPPAAPGPSGQYRPRRERHSSSYPSSLYPLRPANTPRRGEVFCRYCAKLRLPKTLPPRPASLACIPHRGRHNTSHPSSLYPLRPANTPEGGGLPPLLSQAPFPQKPPAAPGPSGQYRPRRERHSSSYPSSLYPLRPANTPEGGSLPPLLRQAPPAKNPSAAPAQSGWHPPQGKA